MEGEKRQKLARLEHWFSGKWPLQLVIWSNNRFLTTREERVCVLVYGKETDPVVEEGPGVNACDQQNVEIAINPWAHLHDDSRLI